MSCSRAVMRKLHKMSYTCARYAPVSKRLSDDIFARFYDASRQARRQVVGGIKAEACFIFRGGRG